MRRRRASSSSFLLPPPSSIGNRGRGLGLPFLSLLPPFFVFSSSSLAVFLGPRPDERISSPHPNTCPPFYLHTWAGGGEKEEETTRGVPKTKV